MKDPTTLYQDRVDSYVAGRPSYPMSIISYVAEAVDLTPTTIVADVGSGSGLFTQLLLRNGNPVLGIEPNPGMRAAAERILAVWPTFTSVDGTAEAMNLPDGSVDLITAAQALHWFDIPRAQAEFRRVLRPDGPVVLLWNERRRSGSALLTELDHLLLDLLPEYRKVDEYDLGLPALLDDFLGPAQWTSRSFTHTQTIDAHALVARVLSSSYAPNPSEPHSAVVERHMRDLHRRHSVDGFVQVEYDALVVCGSLRELPERKG